MQYLTLIPLWICSVLWHMWRIVTMRPAFKNLGDTKFTALSFAALFLGAGVLRHTVLGSELLLSSLSSMLVYGIFLAVLVERKGRSSGLTFVYLGISAAIDLIACAIFGLGLFKTPHYPPLVGTVIEVALMIVAYQRFRLEPFEVQARGYRPDGKASVMDA